MKVLRPDSKAVILGHMFIESLQNPKVKRLVSLQKKRRDREEAGVMLVEGHDELAAAVAAGVVVKELYVCPELMGGSVDAELQARIVDSGAGVTELAKEVFQKVAYREGPDGWLAVVPGLNTKLTQLRISDAPLVLVAEGIEKPGNLGAMLRTAAAAGAEAVICVDGVVDVGNPNVVRASKGTVFTVPVAEATRSELVAWLQEHKIRLVAAAPRAQKSLWGVDLTRGVALVLGAEHEGLSVELLAAADETVQIPMVAEMDSLNASTSAAILLYEALRQRKAHS
jgi:TrmH family RNA methyltransferase